MLVLVLHDWRSFQHLRFSGFPIAPVAKQARWSHDKHALVIKGFILETKKGTVPIIKRIYHKTLNSSAKVIGLGKVLAGTKQRPLARPFARSLPTPVRGGQRRRQGPSRGRKARGRSSELAGALKRSEEGAPLASWRVRT